MYGLQDEIAGLMAEVAQLTIDKAELVGALQELYDWQNGPPLTTWTDPWNDAMEVAADLIAKHKGAE